MKNYLTYFLCLTGAFIASCGNKEHPDTPATGAENKVNFVTSITSATGRTTTAEETFVTQFATGDPIGIYATGAAAGNYNVKHTVNGDNGTLSSEEGVYYNGMGDTTADFYAYYPWSDQSASANNSVVTFSVQTDQNAADRFNGSDFMTAITTGVPDGTEDVSLKFNHRLAMIQVEVTSTNSANTVSAVSINNVRTGAIWTYATDQVTVTEETATLTMWNKRNDGTLFWALLPEQTIAAGVNMMDITVKTAAGEEKGYVFTTSAPIGLKANTVKKFRIGIGEKVVSYSTELTVNNWTADSEVVEGNGELIAPKTLLETEGFANFRWTEIERNKEEITAGGWYRFQANAEDKVEWLQTEQMLHLNRATIPGWHNGTFYFAATDVIKGKYALKFKAKSTQRETDTDQKKNQLRLGAYMKGEPYVTNATTGATNNDYFAIIQNGENRVTTVYTQILTYDTMGDYTVTFDLGQVSTIHNGTAANVTEESKSVPTADMLKTVIFYISANVAAIDFWIDDVSITPAN